MRRNNTETIKSVSQQLIRMFRIDEQLLALNIKQDWSVIITNFCNRFNSTAILNRLDPETIVNYTQGVRLKDKKLFISLTSAPLITELSMNSVLILEQIHRQYDIGYDIINSIVFN